MCEECASASQSVSASFLSRTAEDRDPRVRAASERERAARVRGWWGAGRAKHGCPDMLKNVRPGETRASKVKKMFAKIYFLPDL